MDIIYLLKVVFRRKWTILFCTMLGLAGGLIFKFFLPKQYVSTDRIKHNTGIFETDHLSLESIQLNGIVGGYKTSSSADHYGPTPRGK